MDNFASETVGSQSDTHLARLRAIGGIKVPSGNPKLTKQQRYYLGVINERGSLDFGWGGLRSTLVVRELEQKGMIRLLRYPVIGSTGFHWRAHSLGRPAPAPTGDRS